MAEQGEHGISWTDATWNPIRGCSRVSEGCRHCYAERVAYRFSGSGQPYEGLVRVRANGERVPEWNGTVRVVEEHMLDPLRWKKPRRVFVNSMSDLFHENVADETIDRIFAVMALAPQHTFQVLTKRPARMLAYLTGCIRHISIRIQVSRLHLERAGVPRSDWGDRPAINWGGVPLPNVWLGVSVENQATADERIPLLLKTPAAVRWISAEPLLGPIDLTQVPNPGFAEGQRWYHALEGYAWESSGSDYYDVCNDGRRVDWVVVGGESGPGARPMHPEWARTLRNQCQAAGAAFHFKQWGEWVSDAGPWSVDDVPRAFLNVPAISPEDPYRRFYRVGKHKAGRELDGREWNEYPHAIAEEARQ